MREDDVEYEQTVGLTIDPDGRTGIENDGERLYYKRFPFLRVEARGVECGHTTTYALCMNEPGYRVQLPNTSYVTVLWWRKNYLNYDVAWWGRCPACDARARMCPGPAVGITTLGGN